MIAHTVWLPKSSGPVSQLPFLVHPVIGRHPHSASSQPFTFRMFNSMLSFDTNNLYSTLRSMHPYTHVLLLLLLVIPAGAQLIDKHKWPNVANEGISKTYTDEIGAGRGSDSIPDSSLFLIRRDPFRAVRRGRQLFQRKFLRTDGLGRLNYDGDQDVDSNNSLGAGLSDSCAACHGRPRGSAGAGGDVASRPDSRDAPHLFGLGLKEMLADEITLDLRVIRTQAIAEAKTSSAPVSKILASKGVFYGSLTAKADGSVDSSQITGVDPDLRVRPFFAHGGTISIREFVVGALNNEIGMQAVEPDLMRASKGARIETPSGLILDGALDKIEAPVTDDPSADPDGDGMVNEVPESIIDYFEFYLLNYFKPGTGEQTPATDHGRLLMESTGCTACHIGNLQINRDRRVADLNTVFDPANGNLNRLFATAAPLIAVTADNPSLPSLKLPALQPFLVKDIFTDFKRHDLGMNFAERNYDGTVTMQFLTTPLWGVGTTAPYGHDGRSISLQEVILRHGGEAQESRDRFAALARNDQRDLTDFLSSLILFPPDDTASTLDPGNRTAAGFPQVGHGAIKLTVLFNDPKVIE